MKNVLITGASGFIGGHLLEANLKKGNSVRALVLPGDTEAARLSKKKGVKLISGDIRDYDCVRRACKGMDIVFHCAATVTDWAPKALFKEVTVGGAENACRAALEANVGRFVEISTNDVFGTGEKYIMDESFPLRKWGEPYPDSKIEAEKIAWRFHREHGLPVTMVYPCWVFGPGDMTFVYTLAEAIVKGELLFWRKDVIVWPAYIDNLVDLLMLISTDERAVGNGYLVHDGEYITLQEFCKGIAEALGKPPAKLRIPYFAAYAASFAMEMIWKALGKKERPLLTTYVVKNLGSRLRFTIEKAERELGWKPKVPFKEGFAHAMEWLKSIEMG